MKNAEAIFHKAPEVLEENNIEKLASYWRTTQNEERQVCSANIFIFSRLYKLTGDLRYKELYDEYDQRLRRINEREELFKQLFDREEN